MDEFQRSKLESSIKVLRYMGLLFQEITEQAKKVLQHKSHLTICTAEFLESIARDGVLRVLVHVHDNDSKKRNLYEAAPIERLISQLASAIEYELGQMGA